MWPRLMAVGVAVVGVALVVLGVLMATVWKLPVTSSVKVLAAAGVPVVVTAPGALSLDGRSVDVVAVADSPTQPVFLGIGRSDDVDAYLNGVSQQVLTGISAAGEAVVEREEGKGTVSDPVHSDVWVASEVGSGTAQLTWPEQKGAWTLVAALDGTGSGPKQVTFTWRLAATRSMAPAVIALGALVLVVGLVALAMIVARSRQEASS